ncbi:MAG: phenylalanine--tRNA ligase subunit alpha [Pseudomonadota bacterium]
MQDIDTIKAEAEAAIAAADSIDTLDQVRVELLGKKGRLTALLKGVSALPKEERPEAGKLINVVKQTLTHAISERRASLEADALLIRLSNETVDMTLPGRGGRSGSLHPVTLARRRIEEIFVGAGFGVRYGPEIEDDFHNFGALNIPEDHPARAMHDTFYFGDGRLLRTHTSPTQIRTMQQEGVPVRVICPGRVYRCDSDQTHTPMFHQVEGLVIDRNVSFANLKSVLHEFVSRFFERDAELRFRPSYFPFTEPSAEVDVLSEDGRWLEILGCGMVHPNVLRNVGVDPEEYGGYAFGLGVERLAMLRYQIDDLRTLFENDLRFLEQFV